MKFPNTINQNTLKSYLNPRLWNTQTSREFINSLNLDIQTPASLREMCLTVIAANWEVNPLYHEINEEKDKKFMISLLKIKSLLPELCQNIDDDKLWKTGFQDKWHETKSGTRPWKHVYMEKHLSEYLENLKPSDYDEEKMVKSLELYSSHIENLSVRKLQPAMNETGGHILLNVVISNLVGLRKIELSFDVKNIGTNFYLGCSNFTDNDLQMLCKGLRNSTDLHDFELANTKLVPKMMKELAIALDKGCSNLKRLALPNCAAGDSGLTAFLTSLTTESFIQIEELNLQNNFISSFGMFELVKSINQRQISTINLRLNPIKSDGANVLLGMTSSRHFKWVNLSSCSIDYDIGFLLRKLVRENSLLEFVDVSVNELGNDLGTEILNEIQGKQSIKNFNVRNTGISAICRMAIDQTILDNLQ